MATRSHLTYRTLSEELTQQIQADKAAKKENPYRFADGSAIRRDMAHDVPNLWRTVFVRDIEKILHLPAYNRYADKTQVFSLYHNDDLSRRALHVQLVSRIARNIGSVLGLNTDLIEAIALGHDLGHTPFGHTGERFLNQLYHDRTGRFFNHNVHSVRVLDKLYRRNMTLQTLDGILCHNGEFEQQCYKPKRNKTFADLDYETESCYSEGETAVKRLVPSTLEGCVVRICDMIAYLGKDRQDAKIAHIIDDNVQFHTMEIGTENAEIINNLTVDIIENSYGKDYILLSPTAYSDLKTAKQENFRYIYDAESNREGDRILSSMFTDLYDKLRADLLARNTDSLIYTHHIRFMQQATLHYGNTEYEKFLPDDIVTDYLAAMTDDYFIALYAHLFPDRSSVLRYKSYFEEG